MKVSSIGSNQTEVSLSGGVRVLISYQTPVAAYVPGRGYLRTSGNTPTTSRHITMWMGKGVGTVVSDQEIQDIVNGVTTKPTTKKEKGAEPFRAIKL